MAEFWNSTLTEKSWEILQDMKMKYNFVLLGGWAVYLLTMQQKSKDIDILIDMGSLLKFKQENRFGKNDRLKKYEIKIDEIDIDIYLEGYSDFIIPSTELRKFAIKIEGFDVVCAEVLAILKQSAYEDRINSIKGEKDKIDLISLIFYSGFNFKKYLEITRKYKLEGYFDLLISLIKNFKDHGYLNMNPREFKIKKNKILSEIKRLK